MAIFVKVHKSYRTVVAICDSELLGKKFEEDIRQLELNEHFFKGEEVNEEEAIKKIRMQMIEDATFNIVGKKSIDAAIEAGAIDADNVTTIQGIPFALKLL